MGRNHEGGRKRQRRVGLGVRKQRHISGWACVMAVSYAWAWETCSPSGGAMGPQDSVPPGSSCRSSWKKPTMALVVDFLPLEGETQLEHLASVAVGIWGVRQRIDFFLPLGLSND